MKRRDSWHSQILFCASLNTLLVAITVAMVIVARIYIGKCHDVCAFAGSNLHKLTGNVKSVLYAGEVEEYIDEFILVDNSTNLVCMLTQSTVSLDALLRLESVQSGKYKQRLFCFAHESLSTDALTVILSKLSAVLRRTEIYCAGVGNISCKSLYAAILGDCPLGEKCIDQRMLCVPLEDWTGGTGEIVRLRYVWPKRYPVEFLENTSDEVESADSVGSQDCNKKNPETCDVLLCRELEAYYHFKCKSGPPIERKGCAIEAAKGSSNKLCNWKKRPINEFYRKAREMFDKCVNAHKRFFEGD